MKKLVLLVHLAAISLAAAARVLGGPINIVHLGPPDVIKFNLKAGNDTLDFTLAHGENSGSFILPDKPTTIKSTAAAVPGLDIPSSEEPRVAVLAAAGDGYKWHLIPAKPTPDKWSLRVINLTPAAAAMSVAGKPVEVPRGGQSEIPITGKFDIRIVDTHGNETTYEGSEPSAVIAFLLREKGDIKILFVPDR